MQSVWEVQNVDAATVSFEILPRVKTIGDKKLMYLYLDCPFHFRRNLQNEGK